MRMSCMHPLSVSLSHQNCVCIAFLLNPPSHILGSSQPHQINDLGHTYWKVHTEASSMKMSPVSCYFLPIDPHIFLSTTPSACRLAPSVRHLVSHTYKATDKVNRRRHLIGSNTSYNKESGLRFSLYWSLAAASFYIPANQLIYTDTKLSQCPSTDGR